MTSNRFRSRHFALATAISTIAVLLNLAAAEAAAPMYQVTGKQHLGGALRWDYLTSLGLLDL